MSPTARRPHRQTGGDTTQAGVRELCDRYGLESDPFAETPGRFYAGGQRQIYLETLRHLCSFGDLLLVVEGEPGVGRTRLVNEFARIDKGTLTFHRLGSPEAGSTAALAHALWGLLRQPMPDPDPERAISAFFGSAHWQRYAGKRWVLVLDDADAAPPDVIDALAAGFRKAERDRAPVPLLVASPGFAAKLEQQAGSGRPWSHSLWIRPLDAAETAQFVESCISWAGGDPGGLLGPERRRRLHQASGGVFARIRQVAPQVILGAGGGAAGPTPPAPSRENADRRPARKRRSTLWLALAMTALIASYGIVSWQYGSSERDDELLDPAPDLAPVDPADSDEVTRMRQAIAAAEQRLQHPASQRVLDEIELPLMPGEQSGEHKAAAQPGSTPLLPESLEIPIERLIASALPAAPEPAGTVAAQGREIPSTVKSPVDPEGAEVNPGTEQPGSESEVAPVAALEPEPEPESAPEVFEPKLPGAFRDRGWIEAQPAGSVTVQLLGSYNEDIAVNLIRRYPDSGFMYVLSTYKNQPWFVVLLDVFEDAAPARDAIRQLPAAIRRTGPWIRDTDGL